MEMRVFRADGTLTHLALHGRMDYDGIESIERGFLAVTAARGLPAVVDLGEVTFMVSIGMRMLIEAAKALAHQQQAFILTGPRGLVREALHIAKLDEVFTIVDSAKEALARIESEA